MTAMMLVHVGASPPDFTEARKVPADRNETPDRR